MIEIIAYLSIAIYLSIALIMFSLSIRELSEEYELDFSDAAQIMMYAIFWLPTIVGVIIENPDKFRNRWQEFRDRKDRK